MDGDKRAKLLELAGGKCVICGYDEHAVAIDFHHIGPKKFSLTSDNRHTWEECLQELTVTRPVCARCHRLLHAGLASIPASQGLLGG